MLPTKTAADELLTWAHNQNPGPWADHCRVVARVAETIAQKCGLDAQRAYVSGLLHDIGRYAGVRDLYHVYAGYELLKSKNFDLIADICLSHSFPYQDIGAYSGRDDCTDEEVAVITSYLASAEYNDYDRLIQLCDAMGAVDGVCLIETRIVGVVRRYGFNDFTLRKWESTFEIKAYFDRLCGVNVYDLFYDEIRDVSFRR